MARYVQLSPIEMKAGRDIFEEYSQLKATFLKLQMMC